MANNMTPTDSGQTDDSCNPPSCCHRNIVQYLEIKDELKSLRQTLDVAVKMLSKLVDAPPGNIHTVVDNTENTSESLLKSDETVSAESELPDIVAKQSIGSGSSVERMETEFETNSNISSEESNTQTEFETIDNKNVVEGEKGTLQIEDENNTAAENEILNSLTETRDICKSVVADSALSDLSKSAEIDEDSLSILEEESDMDSEPLLDSIVKDSSVQVDHTDTAAPVVQTSCMSLVPAESDFCTASLSDACASVVTVPMLPNTNETTENVKVKEEQLSESDDSETHVPVLDLKEGFEQHEEVKMEPEGVFISDGMLPECVLLNKEEEFSTSNIQDNSSSSCVFSENVEKSSTKNSGENSNDNLPIYNESQSNINEFQDLPFQVVPLLRASFGSALVSKLKQKIQEKIQATSGTVEEDNTISVREAHKYKEISHSGSKNFKTQQRKLEQKFYQCRSCAKVFFCKISLCTHKKKCNVLRKQYHCSYCPRIFKSKVVLLNHRQIHFAHESKGRHKCQICRREFILKSTLRKHKESEICLGARMKCYRKLPQYFCVECGQGFINASNLELHQKLHKVDKGFPSSTLENTDCKSEETPVVVTRSVRRYPCGYCEEAFIDRRSVTLHEKLHTDKEFAAFDQERRMIQRKHQLMLLMQKQQQQNKRNEYDCKVCGRCYPIELLLHMHTRLHHAIS